MSFEDNWGYKGRRTRLNGLTNWLQINFDWRGGSSIDQYNRQLRLIEQYGKEVLGLKLHGHLQSKATHIANIIHGKNGFKAFTEWANLNALKPTPHANKES
jgi:hypothetical protein